MQFDQLQPYMLPWDARHLQLCLSDLLSEAVSHGTLEPSLFCSPGSNSMLVWSAGIGHFSVVAMHASGLQELLLKH